jgi:hypothetical protein
VDTLRVVFELGDTAERRHAQYWDWDLQLLRQIVSPWPEGWPRTLNDACARAMELGQRLPVNELPHHPRSDALWLRRVVALFDD